MALQRFRLKTIVEDKDESFLSKRWEDFDHSQKLNLGVWGSAWTVRDRKTNERFVLQSCKNGTWDYARKKLLDISRADQNLFASPRYLFFRNDNVFVCSEEAGIALAEIIDSTLSLTEAQAATILKRVIQTLQVLSEAGIAYPVKASNVFLAANLTNGVSTAEIRIAGFGSRLRPEHLPKAWQDHLHCESVGHLLYHMLTRHPKILPGECHAADQMMVVRTNTIDIPVQIEQQLSAEFFDFIETCMAGTYDLKVLLHHVFLRKGKDFRGLCSVIQHTQSTSVVGNQWKNLGEK